MQERTKPPTSSFPYWDLFLKELEGTYGKATLDRWARSLKVEAFHSSVTFLAKDSFQTLWFDEHIRQKFSDYLAHHHIKCKIELTVEGQKKPNKPLSKRAEEAKDKKPYSFHLHFPELDPTATYERFLVHEENEIPFKIVEEVCSSLMRKKISQLSDLHSNSFQEEPSFGNPVYLYGPSGSGKTHLLQASAHKLRQAGFNAVYARSDLFTEHVIRSIRAGEMSQFRKLWRNVDILFVDDVHLLAKKSATQEEFFHTFNTLHTAGTQLFLAANCLPQQLQFIEQRLISRFSWGIVLELTTIPKKMYRALVEQKAQALQFVLSPKIINFLLDHFSSSPKACCQALEALILRSSLSRPYMRKASISMSEEQLRSLLKDLIEEEEKTALTFERIVSLTAQAYGITESDLLGKSQSRECVLPRQITMYLMRKHLKLSYMKIGDRFFRDHSTVMSAIRQIEKLIKDSTSDVGSSVASLEVALQTSTVG